jgi:MarR family transcriptional regulator, transcriptional regulator for hemolysin
MKARRAAPKVSQSAASTRRARTPRAVASQRTAAAAPAISRSFYEWVPEGVTVGSVEDKKLRLTRRILFLSRRWLNTIDGALRKTGDSHARWVTLLWVGMMAGRAKIGELADQIGVELPTLVRLLNRLEQEGLVERRALDGSNRAKTVVLTPKGKRLSASMNEIVSRARIEFLKDVNEEQLTAALGLLDGLLSKYARVVMWPGPQGT